VWTDSIIAAGAIGAIVWIDGEAQAAGSANLETHEPMTPQHRTRVGSIDKTYMAVVAVWARVETMMREAQACR
jgi:hypothetical protein